MIRTALDWVRSGDGPGPRTVRAARRGVARAAAIARHRSIPGHLAAVSGSVPPPPPAVVRRAHPRHRVVEVSTYPLHPRHSGGQLRGWYLAEALTQGRDTEVSVVSLTTVPARAGRHHLAPGLVEHCVALPDAHERREAALRLVTADVAITDIAAGLMWAGIDEFAERLADELATADVAVLVQPYLVDAVRALAPDVAVVCDEHNDELTLKRSILPTNSAGRWLLDRVDRLERTAVESAAVVTATTDTDLHALAARYRIGAPTAVVPNGVDTASIEFVTGGDRARRRQAVAHDLDLDPGRRTAVFVGSGHRPNIDAGRHIVELARATPDVDFLLAGAHSTHLADGHIPANAHLLGPVSDELLDLLLASCDVALNPMSGGSGSNLKLLTYLAAGIPVVSTDVGARGIDAAAAGVEIEPLERFAAGIDSALRGDGTERSLAGRRYVEEHCDWRAIGRRFAALVEDHLPT